MARVEKTVFLSYRRTDFPWGLAIYTHLTHSGFDVFFDYMGIASGDFERVILENIRARAHFLVVLTPSALERCNDPEDWLRREIEEAIDCRRNVVPLFVEGFDFAMPTVASSLTGRLGALRLYNGLGVPAEYFEAAMEKLCGKFLHVPLEAVLHPASGPAQEAAKEQQAAVSLDALTGLVNRREFEVRVERALRNAKARNAPYAVCYLALEQVELVNETWGARAGDALLEQTGELLKLKMHARDTLARLGSSDFGVLLENCSLEEAVSAAESLRQTISDFKFSWNGRGFRLGATIGVAPVSAEGDDAICVISAADLACQAAKEAGRNIVRSYAESDIELMRRRRDMRWVARINEALAEDRFVLFRQTILPLQRQESGVRCELLVGMRDEVGKVIRPSEFMVAAERYGIMPAIDRWVLEQALHWLTCAASEREIIAICSVNLSGQSLGDEEFPAYVAARLHESKVDPTKVCFELTETTAVANFSRVQHFVEIVGSIGCKFALDDFGTGLSSFGYLKHFPVEFLKIDGSFVREVLRDPIDREMVRAITEIGHLTGKQCIAECAENKEIVEMMRALGVDYAQGYGVSRPELILGSS